MGILKWFRRRPENMTLNRDATTQPKNSGIIRSGDGKDPMPLHELQVAFAKQDARAVEVALINAFHNGLSAELVPVLIELCGARWHVSHEDVVNALQEIGDVRAIGAIEEVAYVDLDYLDYDEYFGLARKATWALADIGGLIAKEALHRIAASQNPVKATYARKRLQNWDVERDRKRN
jgi:hypothetical protein